MGRVAFKCSLVVACVACSSVACSSTPTQNDAGASWNIITTNAQPVDKIDLLFAIDNSSSMADKQSALATAIPAFVNRLLTPNGNEFPAVHDLHIGIVSSSLGGATPDGMTCVEDAIDSTHQNDKGHLLNRTSLGAITNAKPVDGDGGNFLAWLPSSDPKNAGKAPPNVTPYTLPAQASALVADFQSLVTGAGQTGCGLEAQLESWYRFLIQPDPWSQIAFDGEKPPKADLDGIDATILKMRSDFLRPDSIVAIVQLTDEEDSWSDPLWLGGYGWTARTLKTDLLGGPGSGAGPHGTSECDAIIDENDPTTGPNDPNCVSCMFAGGGNQKPNGQQIADDVTCKASSWFTPAAPSVPIAQADGLNVRYGSQFMRARYGFDNQPSIQRYVDGLTLATVPDSAHESHDAATYASTVIRNCTNPLFAASLPDGSDTQSSALCVLHPGARTPDMIYFALIGGVPGDLVGNWPALLGKDPAHYVFDGIDPRMIESISPRTGVATDWNTLNSAQGIDLEYACTFPLTAPRDCSAGNDPSCECNGVVGGPPLCDPQNPKSQTMGKAYPTIRELRVAEGLGKQAVVGSICDADYAPTLSKLVDAMRPVLASACLSGALPAGCELLVVFDAQTNQASGCTDPGTSQPTSDVLAAFDAQYEVALGDAGTSLVPVVCVMSSAVCPQPAGTHTVLACPATK